MRWQPGYTIFNVVTDELGLIILNIIEGEKKHIVCSSDFLFVPVLFNLLFTKTPAYAIQR
jgi:hypothetical protein